MNLNHQQILRTMQEEESPDLHQGLVVQTGHVRQNVDEQAMTATFTILTRQEGDEPDSRNRHGNKVLILGDDRGRGFMTQSWEVNPVVFLDHLHIPVAMGWNENREAQIVKEANRITSTAHFSSKVELSDQAFLLVAEGMLNMASVGFFPVLAEKMARLADDELPRSVTRMNSPAWRTPWDFVESEMYEWSLTPVGADRNATQCQSFYEQHERAIETGVISGVKLSPIYQHLLSGYKPEQEKTKIQSFTPPGMERLCEEIGGLVQKMDSLTELLTTQKQGGDPAGGETISQIGVDDIQPGAKKPGSAETQTGETDSGSHGGESGQQVMSLDDLARAAITGTRSARQSLCDLSAGLSKATGQPG